MICTTAASMRGAARAGGGTCSLLQCAWAAFASEVHGGAWTLAAGERRELLHTDPLWREHGGEDERRGKWGAACTLHQHTRLQHAGAFALATGRLVVLVAFVPLLVRD